MCWLHAWVSYPVGAVLHRAQFAQVLAKTPWGDKSKRHFMSREEEYVAALQAALGIW